MDLQDDEARGIEARQVLDSPLYQEAYQAIEVKLINQLSLADLNPESAEKTRKLLVALRKVKLYMEQILLTGKMAEQELEQRRTFAERTREKLSRFRF